MKLYFRLSLTLGILLIFSSFAASFSAQDAPTTPAPVGERPDAPPYAVHGPYWVGTQDFVIDADSERPIAITVWYPALNPDGLEESVDYPVARINLLVDLVPLDANLVAKGKAILNAAPAMGDQPYPLVIYSHGFTAWRQGYSFLNQHLASWGFVVIALDHLGEVPSEGIRVQWRNYTDRPRDITRVLDYAEELNAVDGYLANMIDMESVAVAGHSGGGWTALVAGGARIDSPSWQTWCDAIPERYEFEVDCQALAYRDQIAAEIGLDSAPEGIWPSLADPRVDAIINLAGPYWLSGATGLESVTIPMLGMVGSADYAVGMPDSGPIDAYKYISSQQKALVVLENANHLIFADKCSNLPEPFTTDDFFGFCSDAVWDMARAHDLTNHFVTAFLLDTLKGDTDAHAALAPDAVSFPGIVYTAEGF